jgi:GNAT superfamily N-acetyltransferase
LLELVLFIIPIYDHADVNISAWDGVRLIGIARAITDFSYCCYLSDLAVSKEYQKTGIGTELVKRLREHLGEEVSLLLLSAPTAMDFIYTQSIP